MAGIKDQQGSQSELAVQNRGREDEAKAALSDT